MAHLKYYHYYTLAIPRSNITQCRIQHDNNIDNPYLVPIGKMWDVFYKWFGKNDCEISRMLVLSNYTMACHVWHLQWVTSTSNIIITGCKLTSWYILKCFDRTHRIYSRVTRRQILTRTSVENHVMVFIPRASFTNISNTRLWHE